MTEILQSTYEKLAERTGVIFNGFQSRVNASSLPMFTHPDYGTFVLEENESLAQAIERKMKQFGVMPVEINKRDIPDKSIKTFIVECYRVGDTSNIKNQLKEKNVKYWTVAVVPSWNRYGVALGTKFVFIYQHTEQLDILVQC